MNRNMPIFIIYGPMSKGGMKDSRLEQVILHLHTNRYHIRRYDSVGRALQITPNDTQLKLGTMQPFYI